MQYILNLYQLTIHVQNAAIVPLFKLTIKWIFPSSLLNGSFHSENPVVPPAWNEGPPKYCFSWVWRLSRSYNKGCTREFLYIRNTHPRLKLTSRAGNWSARMKVYTHSSPSRTKKRMKFMNSCLNWPWHPKVEKDSKRS